MGVCSSRGWSGHRGVSTIKPNACILEESEVVVIAHGRSRCGGGKADEFFHSFYHPEFRNVVDSSLEDCQSSGIRYRLLRGRNFIHLSELFIEVENELLSGTFPGFVQDSSGDIGV